MNRFAAALLAALAVCGQASAQTEPTPAQRPPTAATAAPSRNEKAQFLSEIMRQLYGCWQPPRGANASATLHFTLKRDGTLAEGPTLVRFTAGAHTQGVIDTAMLAVRACTLHLPASKYESWRDVEASFDAGPD